MKKHRFIIPVLVFFLFILSCKKDRPDERIFGRWIISEYYLDDQFSPDTLSKYFDGLEYEIDELNSSSASYAGGNAAIKIYGLGGMPPLRFEDLGKDGLTMSFYDTKVPPPYCNSLSTSKGCFECPGGWYYSFIDDNTMEWEARSTNNDPITHQHRLVFIRVN